MVELPFTGGTPTGGTSAYLGAAVIGNMILGNDTDDSGFDPEEVRCVRVQIPKHINWDNATIYFGDTIVVNPVIRPDEDEYIEIAQNVFLGYNFTVLPHNGSYLDEIAEAFANGSDYTYTFNDDVLTINIDGAGISEQYCYMCYDELLYDAVEMNVNNQNSAVGEAVLRWPVYGTSQECEENGVKGYVIVKIYRCKVTQSPNFDSSYKAANDFTFTLSGMDAKREDRSVWGMAYHPIESLYPVIVFDNSNPETPVEDTGNGDDPIDTDMASD